MSHLTIADLDRVRGGRTSASDADAVGRHVRECAACRSLADEQLSIVDSADAFEALIGEHAEGDVRAMPVRRLVWWSIAAAAAIGAILFVLPRRDVARPPAPIAHVVVTTPPPARDARWDALLAGVRATGVLPFPADIRELAAPDAFRGEPRKLDASAMDPVATAIDDERPELRWRAVDGARYIVVITSAGKELARSESLTAPHWRVPIALPRGRMLRWQVRVERGDATSILPAPPAPPAIFRVISREEHDEIARAPQDPFLRGVLYARAGVIEEARRELEASHDPLAARLLEQLP